MPYRKRSFKKKRLRRYTRPYINPAHLAMQVRKLKSLMNVEQKFFDVTSAATNIVDGVGAIVQLTNMPQGNTDITRNGAQVKLTSWTFKAIVTISPSIAVDGDSITVMLIEDKQTNQAIYTTADLLASVANLISVVSSLNLDNKFRFKVHKRWIFQLNSSSGPRKVLKFYKKLGNDLKLRFDGSTPSIADLTTKSLSLLVISDAATNVPQITFFNRLRFVDN